MRKMLVIVLFVMLNLVQHRAEAQTNVYHPFPDSNAIWNNYSWSYCGQGFDMWAINYSYTFDSDTLINSSTYHKIFIPAVVIDAMNGHCDSTGSWIEPGRYAGAIRQDASVRKVFVVPPAETNEQLLYDFNLTVGDSVLGYIQCNTGPPDTVIAIDSILIGNNYRKRWFINNYYNIYYIEGIGSTNGLLSPSPGYIVDAIGGQICFIEDDIVLYSEGNNACSLITDVVEANHLIDVTLFPNPATTSITITGYSPAYLKLCNTLGQRVAEATNTNTLWLGNLPQGLYLLQLFDEKGELVKTDKVVKE